MRDLEGQVKWNRDRNCPICKSYNVRPHQKWNPSSMQLDMPNVVPVAEH